MDFLFGAIASCGAVLISNPFDVVKTRMQLQGELKSIGHYTVIYRNVFHGFHAIAKVEGILALQKGLLPAMSYQIVLNGTRLGLYQTIIDSGFISHSNGNVSNLGCIGAGATVGIIGAFLGSPLYLVKTQLQAQAKQAISVGYQHKHTSALGALKSLVNDGNIRGLWRGGSSALPRAGVGSAAQLFVYSKSKDWLDHFEMYDRHSWQSTLTGAFFSGFFVCIFMSPFDVISTRIYNQERDAKGKGLLYRGVLDCFIKILRVEGVYGLYKGVTAIYLRVGPHSFFNLLFWDHLKRLHKEFYQNSS